MSEAGNAAEWSSDPLEHTKGVVSAVWNDEDMPVGPNNVRADILITAESPFNRLNSGQFNEQFLSLCSHVVHQNVVTGKVPEAQIYDYVLDYINDVQPTFAALIRELTLTQDLKDEFVEAVKKDGIYMVIPPFCKTITHELFLYLGKKYGIDRGPLTYYRKHADGTREKVVTKCKGIIGAKYMVLLGKRPIDQLNVVEFGYINQFMAPMKPNSKLAKAQCLHGQTPMRYGEDEIANLTSIIGPDATARITGIYSNSTVALNKLNNCLLTDPHPSALKNIGMTNSEVVQSSANIGLFKHMLFEIGYQLIDYTKGDETPC